MPFLLPVRKKASSPLCLNWPSVACKVSRINVELSTSPAAPAPQLRVYPRYTVIAEKPEALTSLGMLNSRMKDFFGLWILAKYSDFDGALLARAIAATFTRRQTAIPAGLPIGLSDEFINDGQKNKPWQASLRKNALEPMALPQMVADLRKFLLPVLDSVSTNASLHLAWQSDVGWR